MIRPHPNFRFVATGNTNGSGDETGLYQGTQIQNAANYSRFNMTIEVDYPDPKVESAIIARQSGIKMSDATKIVSFATDFRKQFRAAKVSQTPSPRELIEAAKIVALRGGHWNWAMQLAFSNRLTVVDKQVASELAQRYFGNDSAS
jgi:cobaltochelatase CobS